MRHRILTAAVAAALLLAAAPSASAFFFDGGEEVPVAYDLAKNGPAGETLSFTTSDFHTDGGELDAIVSCHILRHTFATRLCESGINLKVIQSVLGHADVSTTMNIYVDVTSSLKKKEIAAFGDYLASSSI